MIHRTFVLFCLTVTLLICGCGSALAGFEFEAIFRAEPDGSDVQQILPAHVAEGRSILAVSPQYIYWMGGESENPFGNFPFLRRATPTGGNAGDLLSGASAFGGLTVDPNGEKLYISPQSDCLPGCTSIIRSNLDGENFEILFPAGFPEAIAFHPGENLVCWADLQVNDIDFVIACAKLGDAEGQVVVQENVDGIAIDPAGDKLYWITNDRIERSGLDGSNIETLVAGLDDPFGITVDADDGRMWWTERGPGRIRSANLDGSDVQVVLSGLDAPTGIGYFKSPAGPQADRIYWLSVSAPGSTPVSAVTTVGSIVLVAITLGVSSLLLARRRKKADRGDQG